MWFEWIEHKISNRNKILPEDQISTDPRGHECYASMFGFSKDIVEFVRMNNTVSGFSGDYFARWLYFDIDAEDLNEAKNAAEALLKRLNAQYRVLPSQLFISFSGNKGFHIGLHQKLFGGFNSGFDLPDKIKALATELAGDVPCVDLKIYNKNRIFRVLNSVNIKSGLYKIPISFKELFELSIDQIKSLAKRPRPLFKMDTPINDILVNEQLQDLWQLLDNSIHEPAGNTTTPAGLEEDTPSEFYQPAPQGARNETLFRQAAMLFDHGHRVEDVIALVSSINIASGHPVDGTELNTIIRSAEKKTEGNEKKNVDKTTDAGQTFIEVIPEWVDYISPTNRELTLLWDEVDRDMRKKLQGKLIGVIGKGGTRKSLLAQNIAVENICRYGARVILSGMEMGNIPHATRLINNLVDGHEKNAAIMFEEQERKKPGSVRPMLEKKVAPIIGDKLILLETGSMTSDDYDKIIDINTRKYGKVDMLIVDGLSMMGGTGDETARYSVATAELKKLANKWKICILLVLHVSRNSGNRVSTKHTRDSSAFVRGSEKILDNVDAYLCCSLCIDAETAHQEEPEYLSKIGYWFFHNKRGTGNSFRKVYDFSTITLKMMANKMPTDQVEVKLNRRAQASPMQNEEFKLD